MKEQRTNKALEAISELTYSEWHTVKIIVERSIERKEREFHKEMKLPSVKSMSEINL